MLQELTPGEYEAEAATGLTMTQAEAIDTAMGVLARSTVAPTLFTSPIEPSIPLSTRETEVLKLIAEGMTDNEIATALFISRRTVATHARHIYDKIGVASRAAAAAWAVRHGLA
ncbi:MAG: response regulator transcription factor [Gemmatimonadetes bacterium]|nr:response regulator transcription factor [Gemmatimonadota bacterium]